MAKIEPDFTEDEIDEMNKIRKQWKLSWHDFVLRAVRGMQERTLQAKEVPRSVTKEWAGWDKAHQEE